MANNPSQPADLDASKVIVTLATELKPVPSLADLASGGMSQAMTDHMVLASYDSVNGWSAPEVKPYGPFTLMPASSCFQYATNAFEGMKAYVGPDGEPRLFRPEKNMARLARSAGRVALPPFNPDELLKLIKQLVTIDKRWVPAAKGHSLYIRPMIIGTRSTLNLSISDSALLWVMCTPCGPYFRSVRPLSLFAATDAVRAWPGGTGEHKIATNYGPTLKHHQSAQAAGHDMNLWLLGDKITEAGVMNFFIVLRRDDGDLDVLTPPLDGTILPGITRASILSMATAHPSRMVLPGLSEETRLHSAERALTMPELEAWLVEGRVVEVFAVGTAVVVSPIGCIAWGEKNIVFPTFGNALGPVSKALRERILDIQEGRFEWEGWSVPCA
ncbi:branched-chain amino acid aminotransferase II [Lentinus tigrinus ALCF2SS1-7]|uniref:branched-chain amino acid aminotransferase II n=1 Tax=Lentinus tigrinus ALCF2SS1-7 TaxID=1328758 RepID=UPI0011660398|nr:branched-chain amino acid aminotransferase II [Lentinus tigrinus ALCF2SS1-7]